MIPAIVGILGRIAGSAATKAAPVAAPSALGPGAMNALGGFGGKGGATLPTPAAVPAQAATGVTKLVEAFKPLAGAIGGVQSKFTELTGGIGKLASSAGLVTEPLKAAVGVLGQFRDAVGALGNQVSQFTQLANPALTGQFVSALQDLTASIGKMLLPVLSFATKFTRGFADAVFALAGPVKNLLNAGMKPFTDLIPVIVNTLGPLVRMAGTFINVLAGMIRPFVQLTATMLKMSAGPLELIFAGMATTFELLTVPISLVSMMLSELAAAFDKFVTQGLVNMRKLMGLGAGISGGSVGAAVKGVNTTSVESHQSKMITSAYGLGTASADEKTASMSESILNWLKGEGAKAIANITKLPADMAEKLAVIIGGLIPKMPGGETATKAGAKLASGDVSGALGDVASAARDAGRRLDDKLDRIKFWKP